MRMDEKLDLACGRPIAVLLVLPYPEIRPLLWAWAAHWLCDPHASIQIRSTNGIRPLLPLFALMRPALLCLCAAIPYVAAEATQYKLYHRVYHPVAPQVLYTERGTLVISDSNHVAFEPSSTLAADLTNFAETLQSSKGNLEGALYQVALEREGDMDDTSWDVSAVKVVCP